MEIIHNTKICKNMNCTVHKVGFYYIRLDVQVKFIYSQNIRTLLLKSISLNPDMVFHLINNNWACISSRQYWFTTFNISHIKIKVWFFQTFLSKLTLLKICNVVVSIYRISSYSFLPWIVFPPWIVSSPSEKTIQVFIT